MVTPMIDNKSIIFIEAFLKMINAEVLFFRENIGRDFAFDSRKFFSAIQVKIFQMFRLLAFTLLST